MSDRLAELQRQRALAQEQLAWFDREIARESGVGQPLPAPTPSVAPASTAKSEIISTEPEELLKQYQNSGRSIHSEVKRGCFIYFFAAFALLAVGIAAFALLWRR